jgi:hypothetical protein
MASKPMPYSRQEISDAIMSGMALFQEDFKVFKSLLGAADDAAILAATWRKMPPAAKDYLKQNNPDIHRQARSMFGE